MHEPEASECEEALRRLAAYLDRELDREASTQIERHLEKCRSCFSRAEFERRLKERIQQELRVAAIPGKYEERIWSLLREGAEPP